MTTTTRGDGNGAAPALPHQPPARVGQATAIEQSRAGAEVYYAMLAAQQLPRSLDRAIEAMREVCQLDALAKRAFFRFPRGGQQVEGPSIHLARELARCYGNIQYGITELERDDAHRQSQMLAFAWDLQANARATTTFIVPHRRDGGGDLVQSRDVYENNANAGARRVREQIFAVLPFWYVEEAQDICRKTLEDGGGEPLPQRIAKARKGFEGWGVDVTRLEEKIGKAVDAWTGPDVASLVVIAQSIQRRETTIEQEFPVRQRTVTADELATSGAAPAAGKTSDERPEEKGEHGQDSPQKLSGPQSKRLHALFRDGGITERDARLRASSAIVGRAVTSSSDLTRTEAAALIDALEGFAQNEALVATLTQLTAPAPPETDDVDEANWQALIEAEQAEAEQQEPKS
jgi:hypothetical protein